MEKLVIIALVILVFCSGCAVADWVFGVKETEEGVTQSENPPSKTAGSILDILLPGAGGLITAAGTAWLEFRRRAWKKAFVATAEVIERAGATLKPALRTAHSAVGVEDLIKSVVDSFGHKK